MSTAISPTPAQPDPASILDRDIDLVALPFNRVAGHQAMRVKCPSIPTNNLTSQPRNRNSTFSRTVPTETRFGSKLVFRLPLHHCVRAAPPSVLDFNLLAPLTRQLLPALLVDSENEQAR